MDRAEANAAARLAFAPGSQRRLVLAGLSLRKTLGHLSLGRPTPCWSPCPMAGCPGCPETQDGLAQSGHSHCFPEERLPRTHCGTPDLRHTFPSTGRPPQAAALPEGLPCPQGASPCGAGQMCQHQSPGGSSQHGCTPCLLTPWAGDISETCSPLSELRELSSSAQQQPARSNPDCSLLYALRAVC